MVGRKKKQRGEMMSTLDSFHFWLKQAGYKEAAPLIRPEEMPDKDKKDGTRVFKQSFRGHEGQEVMLYTVEGGGHTWPGGKQYLPEFLIGTVSRDIDGTEEIWDFFTRNPKKAVEKKD
jgi:polyhydroxybutyrate depolymerase